MGQLSCQGQIRLRRRIIRIIRKTMNTKKYELPLLPYAYDALEPYIDAETMRIHHDRHHATYVNNLNGVLEKYPELYEKSAQDLIMNLNEAPEEIRTAVRNNAGGHINHSMFWQIMAPAGTQNNAETNAELRGKNEPTDELLEEIKKYFGSFEEFQNKFNDAGVKRFGSGWVWLVKNKNGGLEIITTPNQDNPIMEGNRPILGNDVWEHAYYLKYKNMRAEYLKAWWNVVNWQEVESIFNKI